MNSIRYVRIFVVKVESGTGRLKWGFKESSGRKKGVEVAVVGSGSMVGENRPMTLLED